MRLALAALAALTLTLACGPTPRENRPPPTGNGGEEDAGPQDTGPPAREDVPGPPPRYPEIRVSPSLVTLPATLPGERATVEVTVVNEGDGDLLLEVVELSSNRPDELKLVDSMGRPFNGCPCGPFSTRMHQKFPIQYRPNTREPVDGRLTIRSNDSAHPLIRIPIQSTVPAPELTVSPGQLQFDDLDPVGGGGCDFDRINRQGFQVQNSGSDEMVVLEWSLDPADAAEAFEVCADGKWGRELPYAPGQERAWRVVFWPPYPGTYQAAILLESTGGNARVQLTGTDTREPHLLAAPAMMAWPLLASGESEGQALVLSNDGSFPTTVSTLTIDPPEAAAAYALLGDGIDPETGGLSEPIALGGQAALEVVHTAAAAPVEAQLLVDHDATNVESPLAIRLRGTSPIPMIETVPPALTFSEPPVGEPVVKHLRLENPGGEAVQVWSVALGPAPGAPVNPLPPFTIEPDELTATLDPGTGRLFSVTYTRPAEAGADEAVCFVVEGDDPRRAEPLCTLLSALLDPEGTPPTAAIGATPDVTVPLGSRFDLDAAGSSDPDAADGIAAWRWLLLSRPDGAAAGLEGEGAEVTLTPDAVGEWTVALEVTDTTGLPSAETTVVLEATEP